MMLKQYQDLLCNIVSATHLMVTNHFDKPNNSLIRFTVFVIYLFQCSPIKYIQIKYHQLVFQNVPERCLATSLCLYCYSHIFFSTILFSYSNTIMVYDMSLYFTLYKCMQIFYSTSVIVNFSDSK